MLGNRTARFLLKCEFFSLRFGITVLIFPTETFTVLHFQKKYASERLTGFKLTTKQQFFLNCQLVLDFMVMSEVVVCISHVTVWVYYGAKALLAQNVSLLMMVRFTPNKRFHTLECASSLLVPHVEKTWRVPLLLVLLCFLQFIVHLCFVYKYHGS